MPKCRVCEIILTDEVCRCGVAHGKPSEGDDTICEKCVLKGWSDREVMIHQEAPKTA